MGMYKYFGGGDDVWSMRYDDLGSNIWSLAFPMV